MAVKNSTIYGKSPLRNKVFCTLFEAGICQRTGFRFFFWHPGFSNLSGWKKPERLNPHHKNPQYLIRTTYYKRVTQHATSLQRMI